MKKYSPEASEDTPEGGQKIRARLDGSGFGGLREFCNGNGGERQGKSKIDWICVCEH